MFLSIRWALGLSWCAVGVPFLLQQMKWDGQGGFGLTARFCLQGHSSQGLCQVALLVGAGAGSVCSGWHCFLPCLDGRWPCLHQSGQEGKPRTLLCSLVCMAQGALGQRGKNTKNSTPCGVSCHEPCVQRQLNRLWVQESGKHQDMLISHAILF